MSLRSLRRRQESCTYRLNRAALMRMEEGRRKAMTKEEGYYDNRTVCIQVDSKRYSKQDETQSNSQSENEISRTEEESTMSEERAKLRTSVNRHRTRNRDNTSIRSYKVRTNRRHKSHGELSNDRKLRSGGRRRAATSSYKEPEYEGDEDKELNARRMSIEVSRKRKSNVNKRLQTPQTASIVRRLMTPSVGVEAKSGQQRPRTSNYSSHSSDQQFLGRTGSPLKDNRINNHGNVSWAFSPPKSNILKPNHKRKSEEEITIPRSTLLGSMRVEPSYTVEAESKPGAALPKWNENRTPQTTPKDTFDESLLIKQQKLNEQLYKYIKASKKHSAHGVSRESSLEAIESRESVKKGKTSSGRTISRKRSEVIRPGAGSKRLYFKPLTSTVTMNSDQEEVISKWRKRLGTNSPPVHSIGSPIIASSFLRDSHVLSVQGTETQAGNDSYLNPMDMSYLIPEKDSPDISLDDVEFRKLLKPMNGKRSNEIFTANEEQEIFLRMEMEKTKKQIHYLEKLARAKLEKLEAIRWKKKRALEEEAVLNEKLEKLLGRIQELRESDSFAKLLDKQTQVFATKRIRPNMK